MHLARTQNIRTVCLCGLNNYVLLLFIIINRDNNSSLSLGELEIEFI